jgi:hypothetical protein
VARAWASQFPTRGFCLCRQRQRFKERVLWTCILKRLREPLDRRWLKVEDGFSFHQRHPLVARQTRRRRGSRSSKDAQRPPIGATVRIPIAINEPIGPAPSGIRDDRGGSKNLVLCL